ncbi:MAG: glycine cleavage system aminomethyltransferase GcvT [Bacteroidaceae bacterium]|nr:glycine cleavage system aminomethyltransferase GcvT [Bacteroidaceae bacterium]
MDNLLKTCLYDKHVALQAQMSPFAGYMMPIQYTSIVEEHQAVRNNVGMFDVSHMGEIYVSGPDAEKFVNYIFSNQVADMAVGKVLYGFMLYPTGGVVDDLLVYRMQDENTFLLVVNASNIAKDYQWVVSQSEGFDVKVDNASDEIGQIALQGPKAEEVAVNLLGLPIADLEFYTFKELTYDGHYLIASRTGYTGEDGFELYADHDTIIALWDKLYNEGHVAACGLGCRDTLRFEAGLPLYGHEIDVDITPVEAGLSMFVKLDKENDFLGKEACARQKAEGVTRKSVGIELHDKAIPRAEYEVEVDGQVVGRVTTGYRSISTDKSVCVALIQKEYAAMGSEVEVRIRKKTFKGTVCKRRFYEAKYKK